ncbi:MAG: META domain-containing protein [Ignavibacteria bacterium]|nr:META domain-containing protein [Ignavibacteria bacterium]
MNKISLILIFTSFISFAQDNDNFNWLIEKKSKGIDFTALGTEPFWNLEIYSDTLIKFSRADEGEFLFREIKVSSNADNNLRTYSALNPKAEIKITLIKQKCSDMMSDREYPYSVSLSLRIGKSNIFRDYKGCGIYPPDYRLNDIWVLQKINDREIQTTGVSPYTEFKLSENRMAGTMGCNRYFGHYEIEGNKITFGAIASTMMSCPDMSLEREFFKTIELKTFYFTIDNKKLIMKNESGEEILVYKKSD